MACNHPQIMSKNCALFCVKCGAELPADYLTGKNTTKEEKAPEAPKKANKRTSKRSVEK